MLSSLVSEYDRLNASCDRDCPYEPCLEDRCVVYLRLMALRQEISIFILEEEEK